MVGIGVHGLISLYFYYREIDPTPPYIVDPLYKNPANKNT